MSIRILPIALANQIAAGEVVERPASVLKELMENSLDAGSSSIQVEVQGGGIGLLSVRDDGAGIARDELRLAVSRHATSKLQDLADLLNLRSLGFRGEALPSIASVSRLELTSRLRAPDLAVSEEPDPVGAWRVVVNGSADISEPAPAAHPEGTTVCVRDLFFNTPARRKFLRTPRTEYRQLEEVFRRLALARFDVAMSLSNEGRNTLKLPACDHPEACERRVGRLFGNAFTEHAMRVDAGNGHLRVTGWVGAAGYDRAQADCQYFYVNGRTVKDALPRHAMRMAFEGILAKGRQPAYVLFLELDPATVDVNVHPTKHELRFSEARLVHDFIYRSIQRMLVPDASMMGMGIGAGRDGDASQGQLTAVAALAPAAPDEGFSLAAPGVPHSEGAAALHSAVTWPEGSRTETGAGAGVGELSEHGYRPSRLAPARRGSAAPVSPSMGSSSLGSVLGLIEDRALLIRQNSGLLVIDFHAARRAAWVHNLRRNFDAGVEIVRRPLLLPVVVQLEGVGVDVLERFGDHLGAAGMDLRLIGPHELSVRALPAVFKDLDAQRFTLSLLAEIQRKSLDLSSLTGTRNATEVLAQEEGASEGGGGILVVEAIEAALDTIDAGAGGSAGLYALDLQLREIESALGADFVQRRFGRVLNADELIGERAGVRGERRWAHGSDLQ